MPSAPVSSSEIDVLVPLGGGSQWNNNELRFMLRSLDRYVDGVRRVFVVGVNPDFLAEPALHVPYKSPTTNKEARIALKVLWACRELDLSDEVLFVNDDHFFSAPCDARTYPFYRSGTLDELAPKRAGTYGRSLKATLQALRDARCPARHFDIHTPIRFDRREFIALESWWKRSAEHRYGLVVKSVYANVLGVEGEHLSDCKLREPTGRQSVAAAIAGRPVWSIADSAVRRGVESYLRTEFPDPSRFERHGLEAHDQHGRRQPG